MWFFCEILFPGDYSDYPEKVAKAEGVVCGSRAHLEAEETAKRSYFRLILMHGFHFLVWALCVRGIRDTQCGFKLLTRESGRRLFCALHVERWAFDVEMLYIAQTLNIPITEIAVNWTEIEGSKIVPFWSWMQMGRDLGLIWLKYRMGAWKIDRPKARWSTSIVFIFIRCSLYFVFDYTFADTCNPNKILINL